MSDDIALSAAETAAPAQSKALSTSAPSAGMRPERRPSQ